MSRQLTAVEVAKHMQVSTMTVYNWLNQGTLKGQRIGCRWRIAAAELERFARGDSPQARTAPARATETSGVGPRGPSGVAAEGVVVHLPPGTSLESLQAEAEVRGEIRFTTRRHPALSPNPVQGRDLYLPSCCSGYAFARPTEPLLTEKGPNRVWKQPHRPTGEPRPQVTANTVRGRLCICRSMHPAPRCD